MGSLACGTTGSDNLTYLVQNPTTTPGDSCSYTICPSSKAICRLRFDFLKFEIAGPYSEDMANTNEGTVGDCVDDAMIITSGTSGTGMICGSNTGQHLYVDVGTTSLGQICATVNFIYGSGSSPS